ncbi:DNA methyltransferase [Bartonella fuyuanensis]|uniref:DNA methyltransferase n=1 Tax=Bartonella fuyuanensis TaxID=1460968 RepID=UPI001606EE80
MTPKPEWLTERIIQLATKPSNLVLNSFAGSGTTGAVAHKIDYKFLASCLYPTSSYGQIVIETMPFLFLIKKVSEKELCFLLS